MARLELSGSYIDQKHYYLEYYYLEFVIVWIIFLRGFMEAMKDLFKASMRLIWTKRTRND